MMAPPVKRSSYMLASTTLRTLSCILLDMERRPNRNLCRLKVAVVFLSIVCATLLAITISMLLTECEKKANAMLDNNGEVCLTPDCVQVSSLYLANMDTTSDPCEDFFQFACGNFVQENVLYGSTDLIRDLGLNSIPLNIDRKLIRLLEEPGVHLYGKFSEAARKLKGVYSSCFNSTGTATNDAVVLQKYIESLGSWSFSGQSKTSYVDLEMIMATTHLNGDEGLFRMCVVSNPFNDLIYELRFQSPSPGSSTSSEYLTSILNLLGTDTHDPSVSQRVKNIIDIERAISELTPPEEYRKDPLLTMSSYRISNINRIFESQFNFERYLRLLLDTPNDTPVEILVESIDFMESAAHLLQNYTRIAVADYLVWTAVKSRLPFLSKPFSVLHEKYTRGIFSRADSCLELVKTYFSQVLGAIYVENYHDRSLDPQLSDMMSQLQEAFKYVVESAEWMNDATRKKTLKKLASMKRIVAYMEENVNVTKLDNLYEFLGPLDESNILWNVNTLLKGTYSRQLSWLGKRESIVDAVSEQRAPHDTSATYASHQNTIIVWAGLLQYAFFEDRFPTVLKYGGLGFVIGHEIIHGYDNDGRNYDPSGRYTQWWDNETLNRFDEKAECFVDQYSRYKAVEYPYKRHRTFVDGNRTLGENIADNGAVKIAYSAYKNWSQIHREEPSLPGMNLTDDQLFFLGMATPLCTVEAPLLSLYNIKYDVHTQARYRVLGSLRNFEKFAEAYKCPVGSMMNPEEKCSIW